MKNHHLLKSIVSCFIGGMVVSFLFSSCATVFFPRSQKVTFTVNNPAAIVYMDKQQIGSGSFFAEKIAKVGPRQLVIKTPGYKDNYRAIVQDHHAIGYAICIGLDIPLTLGLGLFPDMAMSKTVSYPNIVNLKVQNKLVYRSANDKYIDVSNMRVDIRNKDKDLIAFHLPYKSTLENDILEAEKKKELNALHSNIRKRKGKKSILPADGSPIKYDDTKFSYNLYKTLKSTGFVDTVNRIFSDNNNTLVLEGSIYKLNLFYVLGKGWAGNYYRTRMFIHWYIKNTYNEILDSAETKEISGDFVENDPDFIEKMFNDAIDISYLKLHEDGILSSYMKQETHFSNPTSPLIIPPVNAVVSEKSDAVLASVIVKTKEGHGSGFAVSQDGYLITNYHVIAGKYKDQPETVKILTSDGDELEAQVVRYNKYRDLALLKVNKQFGKAFRFSSVKCFKNLQDVYTIGAPKSIELGQSFAPGVISNERKINNNNLLQLGMSVNSGNSGGPVFDAEGNLHGVIVAKLAGDNTEGVSFAIPGYLIEEYLNIHYK